MQQTEAEFLKELDKRLWTAADRLRSNVDADEKLIPEELEARDCYTEKNVFWVPALARWDFIQAKAKGAVGTMPNGSLALLLANGSMSSNTNNEGTIRKASIEADLVECMVALSGQLFTNTQIPACISFLTRTKAAHNGWRDRKSETLFIDAHTLGYMQGKRRGQNKS